MIILLNCTAIIRVSPIFLLMINVFTLNCKASRWSPLFAGASVGYAVAAVSTVLRQADVFPTRVCVRSYEATIIHWIHPLPRIPVTTKTQAHHQDDFTCLGSGIPT